MTIFCDKSHLDAQSRTFSHTQNNYSYLIAVFLLANCWWSVGHLNLSHPLTWYYLMCFLSTRIRLHNVHIRRTSREEKYIACVLAGDILHLPKRASSRRLEDLYSYSTEGSQGPKAIRKFRPRGEVDMNYIHYPELAGSRAHSCKKCTQVDI